MCVVMILVWPFNSILNAGDDIHARRFCAYGSVYVEFERNGNTWGTTFLGRDGKPVLCNDDDALPEPTTNKVTI